MTGNKCLSDTSVVIHFFKNNAAIDQILRSFEEVYVSAVVVGELYYGAHASSNSKKHIQQIQSFLDNCIIVQPGVDTAFIYGQTKIGFEKERQTCSGKRYLECSYGY
ncbi:MAG: PIN domain-containing protein [Bacteroidota bacterium]|nr:PIN domain-containing protein [Bacteroidota bacterium]